MSKQEAISETDKEIIKIDGLMGRFDYRLELKEGGVTVLIGPNGFGKSTIFAMIGAASAGDERALGEAPFERFSYTRGGQTASIFRRGGTVCGDTDAMRAVIGPTAIVGGQIRAQTYADFVGGTNAYLERLNAVPARVGELVRAGESAKVSMFERLLSKKLAFKTVRVTENGLKFCGTDGRELDLWQLSLGEIRLVGFLFEVLLGSPEGALLLIDEPETSLHVVWQLSLVDELSAALGVLAGTRAIVSTHSPQVAGGHRELMIDLGAQYER